MKLVKELLPFLLITSLFLLTGLTLTLITDQQLLHLSINSFVGGSANTFFKYFTHVGDGITVAVLIVIFSLFRYRQYFAYLSLGLTTFAISGLFTQFLKRVIFASYPRPIKVFGEEELILIQGVKLHGSFSFPSGHSTASFALFIFLAYVFRKTRYAQVLCAFAAILAAFSRVYLSQHFTEDIIAGGIIGISTFFLMEWLHRRYFFKKQFASN